MYLGLASLAVFGAHIYDLHLRPHRAQPKRL
jgi:hypothetical protein